MLTRASVLWADRMVAARSWNGILEVQRAQLGGGAGIDLGQALDGEAGPTFRCPGLRHRFTVPGYVGAQWTLVHMAVVELRELPAPDQASLRRSWRASGRAAATTRPCPSRSCCAVTHPAEASPDERLVLARRGKELVGVRRALARPRRLDRRSTWWSTRPRGSPLSSPPCCGVPCWRRRPAAPVHLWVMRAEAGRRRPGRCRGVRPRARPAPDARRPPAARRRRRRRPGPSPPGRSCPGRDEEAWVETNNRAFAGHPEQGGWSVAQLQRAHGGGLGRARRLPGGRRPGRARASSGPAGPRSTATALRPSARST